MALLANELLDTVSEAATMAFGVAAGFACIALAFIDQLRRDTAAVAADTERWARR